MRLLHDALSRGTYEAVRGGVWLTATAAGTAARSRAGEVPLSETPRGAMAIAALNGLYGDRLEAEESVLAIPMQVRSCGEPQSRIAVFLHGLGETEHAWGRPSYGERLEAELGFTPVFIRFNTGRHISENGASLAALLAALVADWPVAIDRLVLIGHSMGGLVARSACHHGGAWTQHVKHTVSLGTPHAGAPLEQAVHAMSAALAVAPETRPFARFLRRRSAGIQDLRRGLEHPLLEDATHCFVAATITESPTHLVGRLMGDTLVLTPSASGRRAGFKQEHGITLGGTNHLALLNHPEVYSQLREWLQ